MHKQRAGLRLTIGWMAFCAMASASAAGLGAGAGSAVLGQPLDFVVQLQLDAAEPLNANCVLAEVTLGERRVPAGQVRVVVEMTSADSARLRVQTHAVVDEPVVGVQLTVGCALRMSRRYVVLADPPVFALMPVAPAFAANPVPVPATPSILSSGPNQLQAVAAPQSGAGDASVAQPAQAAPPGPTPRAQRPVSSLPRAVQDPAVSERRAQARQAARLARAQRLENARKTASAPARLRLDVVEPAPRAAESVAVEEALAAVAQAASAARAAATAASASAQRMLVLERTVEQLRGEAKANRDLAVQLRQRLSQTEGSGLWVVPLMTAVGLLAALSAWLAWRLGRSQRQSQLDWNQAVTAGPAPAVAEPQASRPQTSPIPFVTTEATPAAATRARASPAWPPPAAKVSWPAVSSTLPVPDEAEAPMQRTEPMPATARADESAPRDVSIEELIDLEQQAEFFVVLGQDDSAIDLLVDHLRSTGGGSPLPYLKLLEIHHRRDEREAYERMRSRFNHRFNAYAPEWGVDLGHGHTLEDYPEVLPRLAQVWARPLDAMAELEALLFRKSRGELFDLPAYREVLFLYSLARDLLDRSAGDSGSVDLLLPMVSGVEFRATSAAPYMGLDREAFRDTMPPDERPTAPVDFDVSAAERPTSIFDLLDDKPQPPRQPPRRE